jgi:hypothetical protein
MYLWRLVPDTPHPFRQIFVGVKESGHSEINQFDVVAGVEEQVV